MHRNEEAQGWKKRRKKNKKDNGGGRRRRLENSTPGELTQRIDVVVEEVEEDDDVAPFSTVGIVSWAKRRTR